MTRNLIIRSAFVLIAALIATEFPQDMQCMGFSPLPFQDGADGSDGIDGDPATDGMDGGDGSDANGSTFAEGGDGGRGGNGGNGVDQNGDSMAQGGNGGNGGNGGSGTAQSTQAVNQSSIDAFVTTIGGRGGARGDGGTSLGFPDGNAGNGGLGGNAFSFGDVTNQGGSVALTVRATAGRGGGSSGGVTQTSFSGYGGDASATAIVNTAEANNSHSRSIATGGNGGTVGGDIFSTVGVGGNGGNADAVSQLVANNQSNSSNAESSATAFGGHGGRGFGIGGAGGNGGIANASVSVLSNSNFATATASARSGDGGDASEFGVAGDGGDATLENAAFGGATGTLILNQNAFGGDAGGRASGSNVIAGVAGNAISNYQTVNANTLGDDIRLDIRAEGGNGGANFGTATDGGSATMMVDLADSGSVEIYANVLSGDGGNSSPSIGAGGNGGQVFVDKIRGVSQNGDATVSAWVEGGAGGVGLIAGQGTSVNLDNVVQGDAPGDLSLGQTAIGGKSEGTAVGGAATSIINKVSSSNEVGLFAVATAGNGGSGGDADSNSDATNNTGRSISKAESEGGRGSINIGGNALANASATSEGSTTEATANSVGGRGVERGGDASAISSATNNGFGAVEAVSRATGGNSDNEDVENQSAAFAEASAISFGLGTATARAEAAGGMGRGTAIAQAWAQSGGEAEATVTIETGHSSEDSANINLLNGLDVNVGNVARGQAGDLFTANYNITAGNAGDVTNGSNNKGDGGKATLTLDNNALNAGNGDTLIAPDVRGGFGGLNGGTGGDAILNINLFDNTGASVRVDGGATGSDAIGGGGGAADGTLHGGDSGSSFTNAVVETVGSGNAHIDLSGNSFDPGSSFGSGNGGNGGLISGTVESIAANGDAYARFVAFGARGGSAWDTGVAGDGSDVIANAFATSAFGNAEAIARASAGQTGPFGTPGMAGTATANAVSRTGAIGANLSGIASSYVVAGGSSGTGTAQAITGGDRSIADSSFNRVAVTSTINAIPEHGFDAFAQAKFGGTILNPSDLENMGIAGQAVSNPGLNSALNFVGLNQNVLSVFELGQNQGEPLSDVFTAGSFSLKNEAMTGLDLEGSIVVDFDIDISDMNDRELYLALFDQADGFGGFSELSLSVDFDGLDMAMYEFTDINDARTFFDDNALYLGGLFGKDNLVGSFRVDYLANVENHNFRFNWMIGNAGAYSIPEPNTALALLITLVGVGSMRRNRRSR